MFKTAILALDLSAAEEPLLDCIPELLNWGVQRLVIVHIVRVGYVQGPGYHQQEDTTEWLERRAAPLRAAGLQVEISVRPAGVPADEILLAAAEAGAKLVVVGSRSQNLVSRMFLGSVARDLIRKTTLPLLLQWIEPDAEGTAGRCSAVCTKTLRHVLLATDLSKHASAAERVAIALAGRAAQIDCLTVLAPQAIEATPALPLMTRAALDSLVRQIKAGASHGEALVLQGEPSAAIARTAQERDCSLIIVGKHGQHWVQSMLIGSTASRLCESAGRPVLLVPLPKNQ
ncbi:MAG: universal stress protein [Polaromonas sp.]|uniref:universal stress protein n=1 Tax=Polaromonas sp. TaxID=1869339 RepID=UPI002731E00A|nr:universal stress protein [Polaromonas sp.]MDP2449622.1 universal stress protein [Polaromonas sp.]MDP3250043.1 universal stress protein [Polaromonas sp.]MDP3754031.1 universal stress protein [Polaromonas sp.]